MYMRLLTIYVASSHHGVYEVVNYSCHTSWSVCEVVNYVHSNHYGEYIATYVRLTI